MALPHPPHMHLQDKVRLAYNPAQEVIRNSKPLAAGEDNWYRQIDELH
jgi:hypothetical protein